jgi:hypothetical protein
MKIEIELSEACEATAYPWWMIVDPKQNFKTNEQGAAAVAMGMITGPFFSREAAQNELTRRRYAYGKGACVWCACGYRSYEYTEAIDKAKGKV